MIRTGFVKAKKGERLSVCFERPSSCEGCKGCSKGLLSKSEVLTVFGQAEVGDVVDVRMPDGQVLKASLLAYAVPLCLLVIGLVVGNALNMGDVVSLALALIGLALGYVTVRLADKYLRTLKKWRPTVVAAHKPSDGTVIERNTEK